MTHIANRVMKSFESTDREEMVKYLEWLRDTASKSEEKTRRAVLYALIGIVAFEILEIDTKSELSLGPLKLSDPSPVILFIPVAVAFFMLEAFVSITKYDAGRVTFRDLLERWQPLAKGNEIDGIVLPPEALYVASGTVNIGSSATPEEKAESLISRSVMIGVILIGLAFEVHAFVVLFRALGAGSPLLWGAITLVVLIIGAMFYYGYADNN